MRSLHLTLAAMLLSLLLCAPQAQADATPGTAAGSADTSAAAVKAAFGAIVGIVKDSSNAPVAGATVTAIRKDGTSIRATVSDSTGIYTFPDLPSGSWSVTIEADGHPKAAVPAVTVTAGEATRVDIALT